MNCGQQAPESWILPLDILNTFWTDLYPRAAAYVWKGMDVWPAFGDAKPWVKHMCNNFDGTNNVGVPAGSCQFMANLARLKSYLGHPKSVPINFRGVGAYDYVLSDEGIDLFAPPTPPVHPHPARYYLYQLFTHRRVGLSAMGVPFVNGTTNIVAPTGPGLIQVTPELLAFLDNSLCGQTETAPHQSGISLDCFECSLKRCWTLQGSIVSAVGNELPRIAATVWMERASVAGLTAAGGGPALFPGDPISYAKRYGDPTDAGLRSVFEERLEIKLPREHRMEWRHTPPPAPAAWPIAWDNTQIVFTTRGAYFPDIPLAPTAFEIYDEVIGGRAANPVFTNTTYCT